jgi:hypothetical protein
MSAAKNIGEMIGTGLAAISSLVVRLMIIASCGRYLGWW